MEDLSFLGVDISKNSITVYDGKKLYTFPNERYLEKFKERIFKHLNKDKIVIIYEPTGPYSSFLEEFAAIERIKVVAINPRKTPYLLEVMSHRAKTDALDAEALYEYAKLIDRKDIRTIDLDEDLEKLSFLLSEYRFIKRQRVNFINHLESIKHNPKSDKEGKDHIENMVLQMKRHPLILVSTPIIPNTFLLCNSLSKLRYKHLIQFIPFRFNQGINFPGFMQFIGSNKQSNI